MRRAAPKPFIPNLILAPLLLLFLGFYGCASTSTNPEAKTKQVATLAGSPVQIKTAPRATYFTGEYEVPIEDVRAQTKPLAEKVAVAAVRKAKLDIVGPLTLFLPDWEKQKSGQMITLAIGYPVSGQAQLVPQFEQASKAAFKCLSVTLTAGTDNAGAWKELYRIANAQGLQVSGENRAVISPKGDGYQTELQLGLR